MKWDSLYDLTMGQDPKSFNFCTEVNKFHLIHEHRWYQLERENLCTVELLN